MKTFLLYSVAALLLFSCNTRPKGVLSESKMSDVLYEIYLSDAVNTVKFKANVDSSKRRSYRYILHKNDVSVANFDSSMVWYAAHPDKQEQLYDNVIHRMEELQKDVNAGKLKQIIPVQTENDTIEIWQMQRRFDITGVGMNKVPFALEPGIFGARSALLMTYKLKMNKADQSKNGRLMLKVGYATGKADSLVSYYKKDGSWRTYRVYMPMPDKRKVTSISGCLLDNVENAVSQSTVIDGIQCYCITYANASKREGRKTWWQSLWKK